MWDRIVESMIFYPERGVAMTPEQLGIDGEEVFFSAEDGVRIHAFYLPAPGARRALLFLHGNAGNASHRLPNAAELVRLECSVLVLDYRGYGLSEGRATEAGVYADARAGLAHLIEQRGFPENRIIVFGRSLGGAVAVDLAQERKLAGVILESTFSSIADVVSNGPAGALLGALAGRRFESASKIGKSERRYSTSTATATRSSATNSDSGCSTKPRSQKPSKSSPARDTTTSPKSADAATSNASTNF